MSRHAEALGELLDRLRSERRGWFFVQCAPGDQREVADEIAAAIGFARADVTDDVEPFMSCVIAIQPGLTPAVRDAALQALNVRRDRLSDRGHWVLVMTRMDLVAFQRQAADIFSVLRGIAQVPFLPRALSADEEAEARRQLEQHYRARFGKLDLRGFVRSEGEDASFPIEDIFQPLEAAQTSIAFERLMTMSAPVPIGGPLTDVVKGTVGPVVLVGGPGAGKSFFLRWWLLQASSTRPPEPGGIDRGLPVLIPLAAVPLVPGPITLDEYATEALLAEGLLAGHLLAREAQEGRAAFLLDGLDEAGDVAGRAMALERAAELARTYPRARIIVTTRPSGRDDLEDDQRLAATILTIAPLSDHAITALLTRWCALYERQREGTDAAAQRGQATGESLARDVLASPSVHALATTPLLATVIAIVHRAGLRLPDRRVELYDHVMRILVERWNQVRTRERASSVPLRLPDAIRLLGPVALEMIEQDREGAIDEPALRSMLARALQAGNVRGLGEAGEAVHLFRESLGLLVERAPGVYGFLHQTLVEFLAAHELVRTDRLAALARNPRLAFRPQWREVILLGAGILGVLQADDARLGEVVRALIVAAKGKPGRPSAAVPVLLAELLADDPALTRADASALVDTLVPDWWFERKYSQETAQWVLIHAAHASERLRQGPWRDLLAGRLALAYPPESFDRDDTTIPGIKRSVAIWLTARLRRNSPPTAP